MSVNIIFQFVALTFTLLSSYSLKHCHQHSCNTYSTGLKEFKNNKSVIKCSVEKEICKNSNNYDSQQSNIPQLLYPRPNPWFLYKNFSKVALNLSWEFSQDTSLELAKGFSIAITPLSVTYRNSTQTVYFCFHTNLLFSQHLFSHFFYDYYGCTSSTSVRPGDRFSITIKSLPHKETSEGLQFSVDIPNCKSKEMYHVEECALRRQLHVKVMNIYCGNNSVKFTYNIPSVYGPRASIRICQGEVSNVVRNCLSLLSLSSVDQLNGTRLYQIPDDYFLQNYNYTISLLSESLIHWQVQSFNFKACPRSMISFPLLILIIALLILLITSFIFCVYKRKESNGLAFSLKSHATDQTPQLSSDCSEVSNAQTVYVIFTDDHPKHKEVVKCFAECLSCDYGLKVIFELWEEEEFFQNVFLWMENSLEQADKVLVIWSPGATLRWQQSSECAKVDKISSNSSSSTNDTFIPVVRQISIDIFSGKNEGKYCFAFFDYGLQDSLLISPFQDKVCKVFKLMTDFRELYFFLKNQEFNVPGGEISVESTGDSIRCKQLELAINDMKTLVKNCQDYYNMSCSDGDEFSNLPLLPSPSINQFLVFPPDDLTNEKCSLYANSSISVKDITPCIERQRQPVAEIEPLGILNIQNVKDLGKLNKQWDWTVMASM